MTEIPGKIRHEIGLLEGHTRYLSKADKIKVYQAILSIFEIGLNQGALMGVTTPSEHPGDYKKIREYFKNKIEEMESELPDNRKI